MSYKYDKWRKIKLISNKLIVKDKNIKTKKGLFEKIAYLLDQEKLITNKQKLINDLNEREKLGSTAFENGLVIPHAQTNAVKRVTLAIVEFQDSDFNSIDKKKSNYAIAIIVPKSGGSQHLKILSKISTIFSTKAKLESFKKLSKSKQVDIINKISIKNKDSSKKTNEKKYDFVAITSCAAGIAHTYMARDSILYSAKKLGLNAKIETQGAITENKLKSLDIDQAKFVIIAADVKVSKTRFYGKKILEASTNDAIRNAEKLINEAKNAKISYGKGDNLGKLKMGTTSKKSVLGKSIMSALSFMIPITIAGGILMAIPNALAAGGNTSGGTWSFPNPFAKALWQFGKIGLLMMVPILSMFLAYKIGGKPAMPAALLGGYFINSGQLMGEFSLINLPDKVSEGASAGFLGGLIVGIVVWYLVKWMRWIKWHKSIASVSNLMFVPILSSFITFLIVLYVIGSPMTWMMAMLYSGLSSISAHGLWVNVLIGILFAVMIAVDLGGPINKTALVVAGVIFADTLAAGEPNFFPGTATQSAISVPPLGMWIATVIFSKKFSSTERAAGSAALPMAWLELPREPCHLHLKPL